MNPIVYWPDESLPVRIYCGPGVLTDLEMSASDGLLAMPRTGLGIGGLLLGRRENGRIEILKVVDILCSHAMGPSFVLTPEEIEATLELQSEPKGEDTVEDDYTLVGWYCSKPNGRIGLSENDRTLFDAFCREPWQVALVIRPCLGMVTTAAFAIRTNGQSSWGYLVGAPRELVAEKTAEVVAEPAPEIEVEPVPLPPSPLAFPPEPVPVPAIPVIIPEPEKPAVVPPPRSVPAMAPYGGTAYFKPARGKKRALPDRWPLPILLGAGLLATLAATAFFTRSHWLP
jgi:proteasome lid subunit RPN8/RPN11